MKAAGAMVRSADPAVLFRAEGGVLLVLSVLLYLLNGCSWVLFGLLLFAPDLSALGYLAGPRVGAAAYNFFHTYAVPALLAAYSLLGEAPQPSLWPWSGSRTSPWIVWWATGLNIPRSSVQHSQRNPRHSPERVG